jgi:ABC-type transporter Mla subunit MlaD
LVLGNVIDNTTVCVPLTHLNDPTLLATASGINGRANLLSLVSVVAPWAYKENSENIARTRASILGQVNSNDPNLKGTVARLENISRRLGDNTETSNRSVPMPESWRLQCKAYVEGFVPKLPSFQNVQY